VPVQVVHDRPDLDVEEGTARVLRFRPRKRAGFRASITGGLQPVDPQSEHADDLAQFEEEREEWPINYRRRALMNVAAVIVVASLISAGVWIADTIAALQRDQDCVMQGRKNCDPPIEAALPRK